MCKIQINVCTKKKESGKPGPHHLSPRRDTTYVPEVYNIQKNNVKLENRYPNTVGQKDYS